MRVTHALAGLALATTFGASAAVAVPLARPAEMPSQSPAFEIEKVHGWHSYCARGPARWHRHVPGAGNVPCAPPRRIHRGPPPPRVIIVPRPAPRVYVRPGPRW